MRKLSEDGRALAIYLLTCPDRTTEGFYSLPRVLALDHLRWSADRLAAAFIELADCDFARYDHEAEVVFIVKGLKYHPPSSRNSIVGAVRIIDTTQDASELFWAFLGAATRYAPAFAEAICAHYGIAKQGPSKGLRRASEVTDSLTASDSQGE